jgi:hypothetical protein
MVQLMGWSLGVLMMMSCLGSLARPLPLGAGFVMTDILMPQAHTSWLPVTSDNYQEVITWTGMFSLGSTQSERSYWYQNDEVITLTDLRIVI